MRKNLRKVIEAFLAHKAIKGDSKMTIWTDGNVIYSYSVPIAQYDRDGGIVLMTRDHAKYGSVTTRNQVYALNTWASIKADPKNVWDGFGPSMNGHSVRAGRPEDKGGLRSSRKLLCDAHDDCKSSDKLAEACAAPEDTERPQAKQPPEAKPRRVFRPIRGEDIPLDEEDTG